jgi:hypothetical protein
MRIQAIFRASHVFLAARDRACLCGTPSCSQLRWVAERVPPERGAAGASILNAELAHAKGLV